MVKAFASKELLAQAAAEIFLQQFQHAIKRSGKFSAVLSGGHTPERTYEILSEEPFKSQINWPLVDFFWGDERCMSPTDPRSNYHMAHQKLLSRVAIPRSQVHAMYTSGDPSKAAQAYESSIKGFFANSLPAFDLIFLGLGKEGHTASLFPNSIALTEKNRLVAPVKNAGEDFARLTFTPPLINKAHMIVFLVSGPDKASILKSVSNAHAADAYPAQFIRPEHGELLWLTDIN